MRFGGGGAEADSVFWVILLRAPGLHFGAIGAEVQLVSKMLSDRTGHQQFFVVFRKGFQSVCF
jgi:hypothetical protein